MRCNVGGMERSIRVLLGILLVSAAALANLPTYASGFALALAFIAVITGAIGFCPLWSLFGVNTCSAQKH